MAERIKTLNYKEYKEWVANLENGKGFRIYLIDEDTIMMRKETLK